VRIKSLQVHGFKSFVDRTVFEFQPGITAVVGPNGCGKSNVVDAIRWVMGEQSPKRLRGSGMDDVIFAGSDNRPPIGMAEVVLTFDNSDGTAPADFADYTEIQITRRLYRSGESEYLMNKTACRLRDIQDFFRDTGIGTKGYTIVEQGRIAEIVSAKADDRRVLVEEAAGISKYKARRREAESKMRSTEQNLLRVNDVLGEIRRQIASLERQAKKAARYKRLRESLRILELSIAAGDRRTLQSDAEAASAHLREAQGQITALETQLAERELAVQNVRIALAEQEKEVSRGAERLYALRSELKHVEGQIELGRREIDSLQESNAGRAAEIEQLREQLTGTEAEAEEARGELAQLEGTLEGEAETIGAAEAEASRAREALRALESERDAGNDALVSVLTAIARAEDRAAAIDDRRAEIEQRMRATDEELGLQQAAVARAEGEESDLEGGLRNLLSERDRLQEQLLGAMKRHERAGQDLRAANEALRAVRERFEARRARLQSLREVVESREDVGAASRHLLDDPARRDRYGVRGLVRDQLEVDREVERAVEAVLAERAHALAVDRAAGAVEALEELRREGVGRGVFVVAPGEAAAQRGIVPLGQPLLERVRPRPGFEATARSLLSDVYLVERIGDALERFGSGRLPATFVTAAGDVLTPDGVLSGGGDSAGAGSIGRVREVRELEVEVGGLEREVHSAEAAQREADAQATRALQELENLRNRHHTAALAVANHEKDLERTQERAKSLGEARETRVLERSDLLAEFEALAAERQRQVELLEERRAERSSRQRELDALGLRIGSAARELTRYDNRVTELRVAHDGRAETVERLRATLRRAEGSVAETRRWIERREQETEIAHQRSQGIRDQIEQAEAALAGKLQQEEEARAANEAQRDRYEEQSRALGELDEAVREVRAEATSAREGLVASELTVKESQLKLDHLDEAIRDKWGVALADWRPPTLDEVEADAAAARAEAAGAAGDDAAAAEQESASASEEDGDEEAGIGDTASALREARRNAELAAQPRAEQEAALEQVRRQIQSLGDVNVGAIEEHEELAERFRFLSEQKQDLDNTIHSLQEAINRINRTSRRRFRETFEAVAKHFSENFPVLFGGGKASLELTEAEDILEAGIEIIAMPPGKRLQNVNLLSGGEKTMTAIALLISVFQVRPSPFFLLDEVDAALDDANVGRFNQLITQMAEESQFLVITHNKRTIEVANVLYGVTMEQKGVSKLVSVALH